MVRNVLLAAMLTFLMSDLFGQSANEQYAQVGISEPKTTVELGFAPNPFQEEITIRFNLPEGGRTSLRVFDILGQEVATVVDDHFKAGSHELKYRGYGLPAGRYFIHINYSGNTQIKQVLKRD